MAFLWKKGLYRSAVKELDATSSWESAVEMEAAALYLNAARAGKNALALLTISDNPATGEGLSSDERQLSFNQMIELALTIA